MPPDNWRNGGQLLTWTKFAQRGLCQTHQARRERDRRAGIVLLLPSKDYHKCIKRRNAAAMIHAGAVQELNSRNAILCGPPKNLSASANFKTRFVLISAKKNVYTPVRHPAHVRKSSMPIQYSVPIPSNAYSINRTTFERFILTSLELITCQRSSKWVGVTHQLLRVFVACTTPKLLRQSKIAVLRFRAKRLFS